LIELVAEREIVPRMKVTDEEIDRLLNAHYGEKKGRKMTRPEVIRFLQEKKRSEALHSYVRSLLKRYHVKIHESALRKWKVIPLAQPTP